MTKTTKIPQGFTDIPDKSWINRLFPDSWIPYAKSMRLDRPIGVWLLLIPGLWSIAMAARVQDMGFLFFAFTMGAIIMRGAGCVYNDLIDKDIDQKVERTRTRPIASGQIPRKHAAVFLFGLLIFALVILLNLPPLAIYLGFFSLVPVAIYPILKRFTYWPQLMLGIAFNWGALMGWAASQAPFSATVYMLYGAGLFWTLIYDTIYAHQDKEDDLLIGVKSTALKFGSKSPQILLGFAMAMFALLCLAGIFVGLHRLSDIHPRFQQPLRLLERL
jgi:4-hydroxybenzoate polyprenyltransferase